MCKSKNLGRLALSKRSGRLSLKACDAQNLDHNRAYAVGFSIRLALYGVENAKLAPGYQAPAAKTIRK
jgi:hypothetical protein